MIADRPKTQNWCLNVIDYILNVYYMYVWSRIWSPPLYDDIEWHPPLIRRYTFSPCHSISPYFRTWLFNLIARGFDRTFATGAEWQQTALTPRPPGPVLYWTCIFSNIDTNLYGTCFVAGLLIFEHLLILVFYFVCTNGWPSNNVYHGTKLLLQLLRRQNTFVKFSSLQS